MWLCNGVLYLGTQKETSEGQIDEGRTKISFG